MTEPRHDRFVSASELAQMGYCERKILFDERFGERETPGQRRARARGNQAHEAFYEESKRIAQRSAARGKCFLATHVLGECGETMALRAFRDLYLRRSILGRWLIACYYKASPTLCRAIGDRRLLLAATRCMLRQAGRAAGRVTEQRIGGRN